jgi:peptide/nickel transport system substrate-binding protein
MFERLLNYDTYPSTNLIPALAKSYDISSDGLTYTFHLRDDVTWHDGTPFTSADVVYTYETHLDPNSGSTAGGSLTWLDHVEAVDKNTAAFHLKAVTPPAINWVAAWQFLIVPASRKGNESTFGQHPVGTGAFKFNNINVASSYVSYLRNDKWWGGKVYLDELRWTGSLDSQAVLSGLAGGNFQWSETDVIGPAMAQVATIPGAYLELQASPLGQYDVTMNTTSPAFSDVNVRKAVVMGINWPSILALYGGLQGNHRAYAVVDEAFWAFGKNTPKIDYDPTGAAQLLSTTNFKNGQQITFIIYAGRKPSERDIIIASLQNLGFNVNLQIVDASTFYSDWVVPITQPVKNVWDITMQSNGVSIPDPDAIFRSYYWSMSTDWNPGRFSDPQVDTLLAQGAVETDTTKRTAIYQQLCDICTSAFVYPGTYRVINHEAKVTKLQNQKDHVLYQCDFSQAWLTP